MVSATVDPCLRLASTAIIWVPGAGAAMLWGDGPYGSCCSTGPARPVGAWSAQAVAFAADRMTVVALDATDTDTLRAAISWLMGRDVPRVAVLAVGDGR